MKAKLTKDKKVTKDRKPYTLKSGTIIEVIFTDRIDDLLLCSLEGIGRFFVDKNELEM